MNRRTMLIWLLFVGGLSPNPISAQDRLPSPSRTDVARPPADLSCHFDVRTNYDGLGALMNYVPITQGMTVLAAQLPHVEIWLGVTNDGGGHGMNVPVSIVIEGDGKALNYPLPMLKTVDVPAGTTTWLGPYTTSIPDSWGSLRTRTIILVLGARVDGANTIRESDDTNNKCANSLYVRL
jgi:hypothetical protein